MGNGIRSFTLKIVAGLMMLALACTISLGGEGSEPSAQKTLEAAFLQQTLQAQITPTAGQSAGEATPSVPVPQEPAGEANQEAETEEPTGLIRRVSWDRDRFYCIKGDGPTTLTFTAEMSDVDRGLAIFWRLYEKGGGKMTDWQNVSMTRKGGSQRTFTFNADGYGGGNNFIYPPLFGESWFQFQFVSGDGQERTPVHGSEVTFFPCAQ